MKEAIKIAWKDIVKMVITEKWEVGEEFTYRDMLKFQDQFAKKYPNNSHIPEKISQILQQLRDDDIIQFVDYDGTYKRLE
ncbi:MAG: hypothetical protein ACOCRX_08960 [Candidatus Woesearchaeota archaeon]